MLDRVQQLAETDDAGALNILAWSLVGATGSQPETAELGVKLSKKSTELAPDNGNFRNTLGIAYYRIRDWERAIQSLHRAHGQNGLYLVDADSFVLAMAYAQQGESETARRWFRAAEGWVAIFGVNEEAVQFRKEAAKLLEINLEPIKRVPDTLAQRRALVQLLVDADPESGGNYRLLGEIAVTERDWDSAIQSFRNAAEKQPNDANNFYFLALIQAHQDDLEQYRKTCLVISEILDRAGADEVTDRTCWACALRRER